MSARVTITLKATEQQKAYIYNFSLKGHWITEAFVFLPTSTCSGIPDQTHFSYIFIKTSHLFDSQPGYPMATDECRNAALLMVMSPVLACLSQEGCEFQFGQTKASITETPCGDFQSSFCALLQHSVSFL